MGVALCTVLAVSMLLAGPVSVWAANSIDRYVFSSGGGFVTSPSYAAFTVIGEPVTGHADGATHSIQAGFVAGVSVAGIVDVPPADLPTVSRLQAVRPNPFQARTTIAFDLATSAPVAVRIFDTSGRLLRVLANGTFSPGRYTLEWDGTSADGGRVSAGIYYCKFRGGAAEETRRLVYFR